MQMEHLRHSPALPQGQRQYFLVVRHLGTEATTTLSSLTATWPQPDPLSLDFRELAPFSLPWSEVALDLSLCS